MPALLSSIADHPADGSKKLPKEQKFEAESDQIALIATIVKNAGIYNAILAGALFWAAAINDPTITPAVARVLLLGAGVAGVFGAVTLKTRATVVQAAVGFVGFFFV